MKNLIKTVMVAGLVSIAGAAYADSITFTGHGVLANGWEIPIKGHQGWTPRAPREIIKVAGKTCEIGTSVQGSVSRGCNYVISITPDGVAFELNSGEYSQTCTKNGMPRCY